MNPKLCRASLVPFVLLALCSPVLGETRQVSAANSQAQRIEAHKYAVVSGHLESTKIGLEVLRLGGNVIDAAVATSLALGVAEPYGSGLGGKLVMLYREADSGQVYSIVALCNSPAALDPAEFSKLKSIDRNYGYRAVGVPGLVAGLDEAHRRWGSLPWNELATPAAELADRGVTLNETMRSMFLPKVDYLRRDAEASRLYLLENQAPPVGTVMKNADLAETLRAIAAGGADAFYRGSIAEKVSAAAQAGGGWLTTDDFANYRAEVGQPLAIDYHGHRIYSCPPPLTGGITVLAALECLEQMPPPQATSFVEFADRSGRVLQCLYPRLRDEVGDVPSAIDACEVMLSNAQASRFAESALQLDPRDPRQDPSAIKRESTVEGLPSASTSHLLVVDAAGNMVSLTQSLSLHFGASVVAPGTGFLLNDSMSNFSTHNPDAVNHSGSVKRARSTIAPILVTKDDKPHLALGIPGGQRIPTTTLQLLWRVLDGGDSLQQAFSASRIHLQRPLRFDAPQNTVDYEADMPAEQVEQLTQRGWKMKPRRRNGHYFGGGGAARYLADGTIEGVADPRRTNFAAGD